MDAIVRKTIAALRHPPRRDGCTRKTLQCDFWNWGLDHLRPACCTAHLQEVLFFTADLLERHEIPYWLEYGTLLGAARGGTFIPWDDDADLGVLASDGDRILALRPEIERAGYHLHVDRRRPGEMRINYSRVNSIGVDLWMWERQGDRLVGAFSDQFDWPGSRGVSDFPASFVDAGGEIRLCGRAFRAPAPLDPFLRFHRYGPDYMTPFRGVRSGSGWCPPLTPAELTPAAATLFARISEREIVLLDRLCRSRMSRLYPWQKYWLGPGLPRGPAPWALKRAEDGIATDDRTPTVERLIHSLATLETAINEFEHPARTLAIRRAGRRIAWIRRKTVRRLVVARSRLSTNVPAFGWRRSPPSGRAGV